MLDKITLDRIESLHPKIRNEVKETLDLIQEGLIKGKYIRIAQALRTFSEQDALYQQGRTKPGKVVTNAAAGQSIHNYGLAFDYLFIIDNHASWEVDNDWKKVASIFQEKGWIWGGLWKSIKDYPHLEKTFNYTWQQLLDKYNKKDFIVGTKYIDI
jgi:peptidoglycan L-alanyl-D-glutamate endopeptidase CwlK